MKYQVIGIEHAVGDFTPRDGKNAGQSQHFDLFRIHAIKNTASNVGGKSCSIIRCTTDQMGQIIALCDGTLDKVPGHVFDMEVRTSYGKTNLADFELVK